jgi:hypothetical protein
VGSWLFLHEGKGFAKLDGKMGEKYKRENKKHNIINYIGISFEKNSYSLLIH